MARIRKYYQAITLPTAEERGIGEKATKEANAAVQHLVTGEGKDVAAGGKGKRKYMHYQHTKIAKYAAENGNVGTTLRCFQV